MKEPTKKRVLYISLLAFLILFILFLFNTRTPHYFEAKTTKAVVSHYTQKSYQKRNKIIFSSPFPVLKFKPENYPDSFFCPLDKGFYFGKYSMGDYATVIYNPSDPAQCSLYTFPYYWLDLFDIIYFIISSLFVLVLLRQLLNKKDDRYRNINYRF